MIAQLIEVLDAAAGLPVVHQWGLAERLDNGPHVHVDADQYTPIATDQYATWSYWRLTHGPITEAALELDSCGGGIRHELSLRLVVMLDNDCNAVQVIADASRALQGAAKGIRAVTGAAIVRVGRRVIVTEAVQGTERIAHLPLHRKLVAIDMGLEVLGIRDCLSGCDPVDVTCAIIGKASTAKVRECLGDRIHDLCDFSPPSPGDCPDVMVNSTAIGGYSVTVMQDGSMVGAVDPLTGVVTVPSCTDPCTVDLDIYIEGSLVSQLSGLDPCAAETINIVWT